MTTGERRNLNTLDLSDMKVLVRAPRLISRKALTPVSPRSPLLRHDLSCGGQKSWLKKAFDVGCSMPHSPILILGDRLWEESPGPSEDLPSGRFGSSFWVFLFVFWIQLASKKIAKARVQRFFASLRAFCADMAHWPESRPASASQCA